MVQYGKPGLVQDRGWGSVGGQSKPEVRTKVTSLKRLLRAGQMLFRGLWGHKQMTLPASETF